jgi:excinuclease UvrABC ATPase subunit
MCPAHSNAKLPSLPAILFCNHPSYSIPFPEARRQLNETQTFVRNFLPRYAQPDADAIENLSMAIVVDQKHLGGGSHSTVGTITDIYSLLRLLYSRVGQPSVGNRLVFSFNDPQGMCPNCNGLGRKIGVDMDAFLDTSKSLNEGAILYPEYAVGSWGWDIFPQSGLFDMDKKLADYTEDEMDSLHSKPQGQNPVRGKSVNIPLRESSTSSAESTSPAMSNTPRRSAPRKW